MACELTKFSSSSSPERKTEMLSSLVHRGCFLGGVLSDGSNAGRLAEPSPSLLAARRPSSLGEGDYFKKL